MRCNSIQVELALLRLVLLFLFHKWSRAHCASINSVHQQTIKYQIILQIIQPTAVLSQSLSICFLFPSGFWPVSPRQSLQQDTGKCQFALDLLTTPNPLSGVSVCSKKEREKSGACNSSPPHRAAFTWMKACWHCSVHWIRSGAYFLVRSVSELVRYEKLGTNLL